MKFLKYNQVQNKKLKYLRLKEEHHIFAFKFQLYEN